MNKQVGRKVRNDLISKSIILGISLISIVSLLVMFFFILKEAFPAYSEFGFFKMYFTADFTKEGGWGIWGPLSVTLFTALIAVIVAKPISVRVAIFLKFRMNRGKKPIQMIINIMAGIPSIVWGLFAYKSLPILTEWYTGVDHGSTIINSIVMLTFMVIPTMVSLIYNQLNSLPKDYLDEIIALGNSSTYGIYKVARVEIKQGIYVAMIVAMGRAIGETMALSIILIYAPVSGVGVWSDGIGSFLKSGPWTLGVAIANMMFTDNGSSTSHLFAAGIALFIIVMFLITIANKISKKKVTVIENPYKKFIYYLTLKKYPSSVAKYIHVGFKALGLPFKFLTFLILFFIHKFNYYVELFISLFITNRNMAKGEGYSAVYIQKSNGYSKRFYNMWKVSWEFIWVVVIIFFIFWFIIDIMTVGVPQWTANDFKYIYYEDLALGGRKAVGGSIMNPAIWTMMLILISILITFPFSVAGALYLSEYAAQKKSGKTIKFFLDSLGGTPSIVYGIFGMIFFIQTLGMGQGNSPYSFMAGALTMSLVILPTFTRSIEQILVRVPKMHRDASYALGVSKTRTIFKVVLPQAISGIITGVILSAGRVIAETAPIYLTLGYRASNPNFTLNSGGHTLTTAIWNNYKGDTGNVDDKITAAYSLAAAAFILIVLVITMAELVQPISRFINKIYKRIKLRSYNHKNAEVNYV